MQSSHTTCKDKVCFQKGVKEQVFLFISFFLQKKTHVKRLFF